MSNLVIPNHIGIIVDGNGRWATEKKLSRSEGHYAGMKNVDKIVDYAFAKGVKVVSIFVFSTENFKRSEKEVSYLMKLFRLKFKTDFKNINKKKTKIVFSGRKEPLAKDIIEIMEKLSEATKHFDKTLNICLNYGGMAEIVDASLKMHQALNEKTIKEEEIDEIVFRKYLYNDLPEMDLLIRTSGEQRLSNFMIASMAYAELYFPKIYFPAFTELDFDQAIIEFNQRQRRFGGIIENTNN